MLVPSEEVKTTLEADGVGVGFVASGVGEVLEMEVEVDDDVLVVSIKVRAAPGETHEVEVGGVVEPAELEDESVRGVVDVVVEKGADDGELEDVTSLTTLVSPPIIPLRARGSEDVCEDAEEAAAWLVALDVEPPGL